MALRTEQIVAYTKGPKLLEDALQQYPHQMWRYKPHEDSWSIHEIVIHIADSEVSSYMRLRKLVAENGSTLNHHDPDTWANEIDYHAQSVDDALGVIRLMRKVNAQLLRTLPEQIWATHAVVHPQHDSITLDDWLDLYIDHIHAHLNQMQRVHDHWKRHD